MLHQGTSPQGAATGNRRITFSRNRKRKRQFYQKSDAGGNATIPSSSAVPSAVTSEAPVKEGNSKSPSHPPKKRRKKKKKTTSQEESKKEIKPVLIVKKPEDYSANWKMLKEVTWPKVLCLYCVFVFNAEVRLNFASFSFLLFFSFSFLLRAN